MPAGPFYTQAPENRLLQPNGITTKLVYVKQRKDGYEDDVSREGAAQVPAS